MTIGVSGRVVESRTREVIRQLNRNADRIAESTAVFINTTAMETSPVDDGTLKESHEVTKLGERKWQQRVGAFYGIYVNQGTRHMAAQPWWSQAVAEGRQFFSAELRTGLFK